MGYWWIGIERSSVLILVTSFTVTNVCLCHLFSSDDTEPTHGTRKQKHYDTYMQDKYIIQKPNSSFLLFNCLAKTVRTESGAIT